jgi:hypothetical protein
MANNSNNLIIYFDSFRVSRCKIPSKFLKIPRGNRFPDAAHCLQIQMQVVPRHQPQPEDLTRAEQMPNVSARKIAARVTFTTFFQRPEIFAILRVLDRVRPVLRKNRPDRKSVV